MAEKTGITWTDHTHNEWLGCSSPAGAGCDHCYAATRAHRFGEDFLKPRLSSEYNRNNPYRYQRKAVKTGVPAKVFCGSLMDFFDKRVGPEWCDPLWEKINVTPMLQWQILTKRPSNIEKMLPKDWQRGDPEGANGYHNVWLGTTVEDKKSGLRRMEQIKEVPARVRFLSVEPLLEDLGEIDLTGIHWVIVGGESGPGFRPMEHAWAGKVLQQCREQSVPAFFKQYGGTSDDAGGCLFNGIEIKEFPK
jgi:protein gp37